MCEVFLRNKCLGCQALERLEDIDKAKVSCEDYKKYMFYEKGEQIKI